MRNMETRLSQREKTDGGGGMRGDDLQQAGERGQLSQGQSSPKNHSKSRGPDEELLAVCVVSPTPGQNLLGGPWSVEARMSLLIW